MNQTRLVQFRRCQPLLAGVTLGEMIKKRPVGLTTHRTDAVEVFLLAAVVPVKI
jgi:hypothetical protein